MHHMTGLGGRDLQRISVKNVIELSASTSLLHLFISSLCVILSPLALFEHLNIFGVVIPYYYFFPLIFFFCFRQKLCIIFVGPGSKPFFHILLFLLFYGVSFPFLFFSFLSVFFLVGLPFRGVAYVHCVFVGIFCKKNFSSHVCISIYDFNSYFYYYYYFGVWVIF